MDLDKEYYSNGDKCNILQMINREPEWAANRLQEGEKIFEELCRLRDTLKETLDRIIEVVGGDEEDWSYPMEDIDLG